ncbi:unnamed protein product [Phytophthora lilii]|uniref:Unnamed protein product n=1 Tax=Phytophthora lilii TaxID=2077276 RepID=A0A9W6UC10_9STRA|nr:unnamed protein product [Phytophthora lilii]
MSSQAQEFFQTKKIEHYNNEPGDHGTMGKIERFNRTLKQRLTKMSSKRITQKLITDVIENYNSTFHRFIKMTPNEAKAARWSKAVYTIVGIDGYRVQIPSENGHTLYKAPYDLKKVKTETTYATINRGDILDAAKILDHKNIRSGKYKYLVRWVGDEPDFWEPQDNLRLVSKNRRLTLEKEYWGSRKS